MKKLLTYLTIGVLALGISIIGRPIVKGDYKGEDFFIVNQEDDSNIQGVWMKDGHVTGFGVMTKEKAKELYEKWIFQQRKVKREI
jgi:hypothetical protein